MNRYICKYKFYYFDCEDSYVNLLSSRTLKSFFNCQNMYKKLACEINMLVLGFNILFFRIIQGTYLLYKLS